MMDDDNTDAIERLGTRGLSDTLQGLCAGFARRTGLSIVLEPSEGWDRQSPEVATVITRIVQEALTSAYRRANVTTVRASLFQDSNVSQLSIADDAKGFGSGGSEGTTGVGLQSGQDRVEAIGGSLEIITMPSGSTIVVNLP